MEFLIVDCPSAENIMLRRLPMNDLDLVTSTRLLTIKFPTPNRVRCVRGEQHLARRYYKNAIKIGAKRKKVNVVPGATRDLPARGVLAMIWTPARWTVTGPLT